MRAHRRPTATTDSHRGAAKAVPPILEAHEAMPAIDSPARLLHVQLSHSITAPWSDAAPQQIDERFSGFARIGILLAGATSSWAGVAFIAQLLR